MGREIKVDVTLGSASSAQHIKEASRIVRELGKDADDTRTKGQKAAAAIDAIAQAVEAELGQAEKVAERVANALGPDFAAKAQEGGRSAVQAAMDIVAELKRVGLTYEEIEADVDGLVASQARLSDARTNLDGIRGSARKVGDEMDNTRSVFANFAGNASQELPGVAGAFGPLNMAISQFVEYASEGNIRFGNFVKGAAGIGAITLAMMAVSKILGSAADEAQRMREEVEALKEVQEQLADGKAGDAAAKLAEDYKGSIAAAKEYGLTTEQVIAGILGQGDALDVLRAKRDEAGAGLNDVEQRLVGEWEALDRLVTNLENAQGAYRTASDEIRTHKQVTGEITSALSDMGKVTTEEIVALDAMTSSTNAATRSQHEFGEESARSAAAQRLQGQANAYLAEEVRKYIAETNSAAAAADRRRAAEESLYASQMSQLDAERALEAAQDASESAVAALNSTMEDRKSTLEDVDDASRAAMDAAINEAEAYARSKGAADGSEASIRRQIESLTAQAGELDPASPLMTRLWQYVAALNDIPKNVSTMMQLSISMGATTTFGGDFIGMGTYGGARAEGGPTQPRSFYKIVEKGEPEIFTINGEQFMLTPNASGFVTAARTLGGGGAGMSSGRSGAILSSSSPGAVASSSSAGADGGDGLSDLERMRRMNRLGRVSDDDLLAALQEEHATKVANSEEEMDLAAEIQQMKDRQAAAAEKAAEEAQRRAEAEVKAAEDVVKANDERMRREYEMGLISGEQYRQYIDARMQADKDNFDAYYGWWKIRQQLIATETAAVTKAQQEQTAAVVDAAKTQADLEREQREAAAANAEFEQAGADYIAAVLDANKHPKDQGKADAAQKARERFEQENRDLAKAAWELRDAEANRNGDADDSAGWAAYMLDRLGRDVTWNRENGRPGVAAEIEQLMVRIPKFAGGGSQVFAARPGGHLINVAEGGVSERVTVTHVGADAGRGPTISIGSLQLIAEEGTSTNQQMVVVTRALRRVASS